MIRRYLRAIKVIGAIQVAGGAYALATAVYAAYTVIRGGMTQVIPPLLGFVVLAALAIHGGGQLLRGSSRGLDISLLVQGAQLVFVRTVGAYLSTYLLLRVAITYDAGTLGVAADFGGEYIAEIGSAVVPSAHAVFGLNLLALASMLMLVAARSEARRTSTRGNAHSPAATPSSAPSNPAV